MAETNLKIIAYGKPETRKKDELNEFTVMFNPNTFTVNTRIQYQTQNGKGKAGGDPTFDKIPPLEFNVEFTIDGTGVSLGNVPEGRRQDYVKQRTRLLRKVTGSSINGEIHRPNYLALLWGTFYIECVITSLNVVYNLFDRDGTPLRAKVTCAFQERIGNNKEGRRSRLESPDLTKQKTVQEGDILPLIAKRNYDKASYYIQLARVNKLKSFRNIPAGTKLILPPISENK